MVTELLLKTEISCVVCTMLDNRFLLFLNHLRLLYSNLKSFALLLAFHLARHSFATLALAHDVPVEDVARMLGHTDIKTTQIYAKILNTTIERHAVALQNVIR